MIHNVFTIYDAKAEAYLPPFILPKISMAKRTFSDCVNSSDHQFGAHPEDYTLFTIGTFDDETAQYNLLLTPESLGLGNEYVIQEPDNQQLDMIGDQNANTEEKVRKIKG